MWLLIVVILSSPPTSSVGPLFDSLEQCKTAARKVETTIRLELNPSGLIGGTEVETNCEQI